MGSRLSPEARARLEAARAIAQGKPAPSPVAPATGGRSSPAATAPAPTTPGQPPATPSARSGRGIVVAVAVAIAGLAGAAIAARAWLGARPDLVGDTATIQKGLLDGTVDRAARSKAVAEVIRNADQMTKEELDAARKSLEEEWQRARDAAIRAFFDAPETDRPRLADEGIDRTLAYRKLRFGLSPQARGEGGRKQRPPKDGDQRKLYSRYAEALQSQAKKRGIDLPEWQ